MYIKINSFLKNLWTFSRGHTIYGALFAILATISLVNKVDIFKIVNIIVIMCFSTIWAVGLNQLYDINIDKINKPYLPLASGKWSFNFGIIITILSQIFAFILVKKEFNIITTRFYLIATIISTLYSVPFFNIRKKKMMPVIFIVLNRGLFMNLINYCYLSNTENVSNLPTELYIFIVSISLYVTLISLFKDIPDIKGDFSNKRVTYATKLGSKKLSLICNNLMVLFSVLEVLINFNIITILINLTTNLWFIYGENKNLTKIIPQLKSLA